MGTDSWVMEVGKHPLQKGFYVFSGGGREVGRVEVLGKLGAGKAA